MSIRRVTRRSFAATLGSLPALLAQRPAGPDLGSLHPTVQALADGSPLSLSFLRPEYRDLAQWQKIARERLFELLHYRPAPVAPEPQLMQRTERRGFVEERLTFRTTRESRVPAHVLIPAGQKGRAPGVVVLHDHGGFYLWGREKVVATDNEHPVLTDFKRRYYAGRSVANELVRNGYVVIVIDSFYWGERRYLLPEDPAPWRDRSAALTLKLAAEFNVRASLNEQLVARSLLTAGVTWPGVMFWDDLRTVDYFLTRPEVDPQRIACAGLSLGGHRSFLLAALDPRIKAAIDVGWMTTYPHQIRKHVYNTMGLTFTVPGMYRYFDLPDLAALIAPRSLLVMLGSRDGLFPLAAMNTAFAKIEQCYRKAGAPTRQRCRMFDAPHEFNEQMQTEAWEWLAQALSV